jgi:hypothetical protein
VSFAVDAVTGGLATPKEAHDHASPKEVLEGRKAGDDPSATVELALHVLRTYRRKTVLKSRAKKDHAPEASDPSYVVDGRTIRSKLTGIGPKPDHS